MTVIEKIDELKKELAEELEKEEINNYVINRIKNKIISLGLTISTRDILTRNHG